MFAPSQQGGFVDEILQIGAGEADGSRRDALEIDVIGQRHLLRMHPQHLVPCLALRQVEGDLAIEAPRSH